MYSRPYNVMSDSLSKFYISSYVSCYTDIYTIFFKKLVTQIFVSAKRNWKLKYDSK